MPPHSDSNSSEGVSIPIQTEKAMENTTTRVEHVPTHDRVPGHTNYYEKGGLRTVGGKKGNQNC